MVTKAVTEVRATRACTIRGVAYTADQKLTAAQLAAIPHPDALLSDGTLYLVPEKHGRKTTKHPKPSHLTPTDLRTYT